MLTKRQVQSLKPLPFEPVFRTFVNKKTGVRLQKPVFEYDPSTGKKVQKKERGYYPDSILKKLFK